VAPSPQGLQRQGNAGVEALRRAAELAPQDAAALGNLGAALCDLGRWEEALPSLNRALETQPDNLQLLIDAANALCALRRPREALPLYERALHINPGLSAAQNNLGNALQELGECAQAVEWYRRALASRPDDADIHCNLGNALRQLGELDEAISCTHRAVALAPRFSMAHNNLGLALAARGRREEAAASFREASRLDAHSVEALNNLGNVLRDLGECREALAAYRRAVELDPQRTDSHCRLGEALFESGPTAESEASFRRALTLQRQPRAHVGLATALRLLGRAGEAEASCRAALAEEPRSVEALSLLGDLCADRGEFAEAHELFERALAINADSPAVLCSIAAHRRMTSGDGAWLQRAQALLAGQLPLAHEVGLRFALGKYHDDLRQYQQAFSHYRQANELSKRYGPQYRGEELSGQIDAVISACNAAWLREPHRGASASQLPVFVIGMPRSGTSLIEQILASHPAVHGAGEVSFWDGAYQAFTAAGDAAGVGSLADLARDYLERLTPSAGAALRVVDKMPANFLYAGLIHAVFPQARILHVQRHPIDTCLSIYFQNFRDMRAYACDLQSLAHYYREYVRVTDHWRSVLPASRLLEIPYEGLVADQEGWTRRMLEFLDLPWDPRCLDFHRTERVVITASRWQVRQRINAGSVGRWRNYEPYVAPLRPLEELVAARRQGARASG
jgi:tetratricopeptide (TPR) repeat protein